MLKRIFGNVALVIGIGWFGLCLGIEVYRSLNRLRHEDEKWERARREREGRE